MLCEVLRRIMSNNLSHKVNDVYFVTKVLDPSNYAYLAGHDTGSSTMLVINYREVAEAKQIIFEQSLFDEEKSFDSTSKQLMEWSWSGLGVPREVARWLAHMVPRWPKLRLPRQYGLYCRIDMSIPLVNIPRTR